MTWMMLSPREVSILDEPIHGDGPNAALLRSIVLKLNRISGDLQLTPTEVMQIRAAARNYKFGYEKQLRVLLQAAERHATDR